MLLLHRLSKVCQTALMPSKIFDVIDTMYRSIEKLSESTERLIQSRANLRQSKAKARQSKRKLHEARQKLRRRLTTTRKTTLAKMPPSKERGKILRYLARVERKLNQSSSHDVASNSEQATQ